MSSFNLTILNSGPAGKSDPDASIAQELYAAVGHLIEEASFDLEQSRLDYGSLLGSEAYKAYISLSTGLRRFNPSKLSTREERLAFWINLYNSLIIHGVIALEVRESVKEIAGFFVRIAYNIGGWIFTPDDIEHGILRANTRHPYGPWKPFLPWDGRRSFIIEPTDPRIHFALVCGASSCPAIGTYNPQEIENQLTFAAQAFINDPAHVSIEPDEGTVRMSQIFKWYQNDFGGSREAVLNYLVEYLDPSGKREWLKANSGKAVIDYFPYEWLLNA